MSDTKISEEERRIVEAGFNKYAQTQAELRNAKEEIEHLKTQNHLLTLENDQLKKVVLAAREEMDIAKGEKDEAVAHRIAYETFHAMALKLHMEFVPPIKPARNASKVGEEAVKQITNDKVTNFEFQVK